jgi:dTDP-4-dehydrorhamnose reductase
LIILILGAKGQLGHHFLKLLNRKKSYLGNIDDIYQNSIIYSSDKADIDICDFDKLSSYILKISPDLIINCAGYTNVDQAEINQEITYDINVRGTKNVAILASKINATLVHFSSDYVFDGTSQIPYVEEDDICPINYYGVTKAKSEMLVKEICNKYYIIRTSWLYSLYGNNFLNTILKLAETREQICVVDDQIGSPTSAVFLAHSVLEILTKCDYGIYHCANAGQCSWYDFATEIRDIFSLKVDIKRETSLNYNSIARRPSYSVLSKEKLNKRLLIIEDWKEALINTTSKETEL